MILCFDSVFCILVKGFEGDESEHYLEIQEAIYCKEMGLCG